LTNEKRGSSLQTASKTGRSPLGPPPSHHEKKFNLQPHLYSAHILQLTKLLLSFCFLDLQNRCAARVETLDPERPSTHQPMASEYLNAVTVKATTTTTKYSQLISFDSTLARDHLNYHISPITIIISSSSSGGRRL